MKLSVSLSDEDLAVLDSYIKKAQLPSRSAGLQRAIQMLRYPDLEDDYAEAWAQWAADENSAAWETSGGGGATHAAR